MVVAVKPRKKAASTTPRASTAELATCRVYLKIDGETLIDGMYPRAFVMALTKQWNLFERKRAIPSSSAAKRPRPAATPAKR